MGMSQHEKYCVGMRGVYAVAEVLSKLNYVVSVTHGNAKGTDILATDENGIGQLDCCDVGMVVFKGFWMSPCRVAPHEPCAAYVRVENFV